MALYKRGQIWRVDPDSMIDPSIGGEIIVKEGRPVVVISSDAFLDQGVRIVIPFTSWQDKFDDRDFYYRVEADATNKLRNDSAAVVLQVRCISVLRFESYVGQLTADQMEDIVSTLGLVVDADF